MPHYRVTYYYMAQGMDGPDRKDYGVVIANGEVEAKHLVASEHSNNPHEVNFMMGCLSAKVVRAPLPVRPLTPRIIAVSPEYHGRPQRDQLSLRNSVWKAMSPAQGEVTSRSGMTAALAITWCEERGEAYTVIAVPGQGYYVRRGAGVMQLDTTKAEEPYDRDGFGEGSDGS